MSSYDYLNDLQTFQERASRRVGYGRLNQRRGSSESPPSRSIVADVNLLGDMGGAQDFVIPQDSYSREQVGLSFDQQRQRPRKQESSIQALRPAGSKSGLLSALDDNNQQQFVPRIVGQRITLPPLNQDKQPPQRYPEPFPTNIAFDGQSNSQLVTLKLQDFATKMREIEISVMDMKADVERRLIAGQEQTTAKLESAIQSLTNNQENSYSQANVSLKSNQDQIQQLRKQLSGQIMQISQQMGQLQQKQEEHDIKLSQQIRSFDNLNSSFTSRQPIQNTDIIEKLNLVEISSELRQIKQVVQDEQLKRDQSMIEMTQLVNYLQRQVHEQETSVNQRIRQAREESLNVMAGTTEEKQQIEMRTRLSFEQQITVLQQSIQSLDKKCEDEIQFRLRSEQDLRQWIEQRFNVLKQSQQQDNSAQSEREKRMMHQMQHSLNAIGEIVKQVKDQQGISIKEISEVTYESIQSTLQRVNVIQENVDARQTVIERSIQEISSKADTIQDEVIKHSRMTTESLQKEVSRNEKIISTLETFVRSQLQELKSVSSSSTHDNLNWQTNFEDVQARKILELQNAIKVLNQNYLFMQRENKEKFDLQAQQHNSHLLQLQAQIKDMKIFIKGLNNEEPRGLIEYPVQSSPTNKANPQVQNQVSSEDIDQKLSNLKRELELKAADISQRQIRKMLQERIESDTLLEGRAALFSVEVEKKVLAQMQVFKAQLKHQNDEKDTKVEQLAGEMQSLIKQFNEEYEQKYVKAKAREEELRERIDDIVRQESNILKEQFAKQMAQNEEMLIRLQIRKPVGLDPKNDELRDMREKSQNEYIHTVVNTMQMQIMNDVRLTVQELERKMKVQPAAKFDSSYLEEAIEQNKNMVMTRLERQETSTQNQLISLNQTITQLRQQVMERVVEENNLQTQVDTRIDDIEKNLQRFIPQLQQLSKDLSELEQSFASTPEHPTKQEHQQLLNSLNQVQSDLEQLKKLTFAKPETVSKDELSVLSDEIKILMQQHSDQSEQHEQMNKDLVKLKSDFSQVNTKIGEIQPQVLHQQEQLDHLNKSQKDSVTTFGVQATQLTDLTRKVNDHIQNLEDVDKQLIQMMQTDEKMTKDIADISKKLEVVASTPMQAPQGDQELQNLSKQIQALQGNQLQLQTEAKQVLTTVKSTEMQIDAVVKEMADFSQDVSDAKTKVSLLETRVDAFETKIAAQGSVKTGGDAAKQPDASSLQKVEQEIKAIKDQMNEDSKYIKTKVDHVTTENVAVKKSVSDLTLAIDKKIQDLDGLMRSLMRGEMDEIDDKMRKIENEIGLIQGHQADQKVTIDSLNEQFKSLKTLTNDMTKTLSEIKN